MSSMVFSNFLNIFKLNFVIKDYDYTYLVGGTSIVIVFGDTDVAGRHIMASFSAISFADSLTPTRELQ